MQSAPAIIPRGPGHRINITGAEARHPALSEEQGLISGEQICDMLEGSLQRVLPVRWRKCNLTGLLADVIISSG